MAQIKSQMKRIVTNEKARQANASARSEIRTQSKKVRLAVEAKNLEKAEAELKLAFHLIDKNVSKGIVTKNTAGREKASLQRLVNSLKK